MGLVVPSLRGRFSFHLLVQTVLVNFLDDDVLQLPFAGGVLMP